ncbi:hypothetical protein D3C85_1356120 [compost metagenome]
MTVDFLLKVTSIAKLAVPPLKVPMMSIKTPFLNKPTASFPLKVNSVAVVEILAELVEKQLEEIELFTITNLLPVAKVPLKASPVLQEPAPFVCFLIV